MILIVRPRVCKIFLKRTLNIDKRCVKIKEAIHSFLRECYHLLKSYMYALDLNPFANGHRELARSSEIISVFARRGKRVSSKGPSLNLKLKRSPPHRWIPRSKATPCKTAYFYIISICTKRFESVSTVKFRHPSYYYYYYLCSIVTEKA